MIRSFLVALAAALVLAGSAVAATSSTTLKLTALPTGLKFDVKTLTAPHGTITFVMTNHSPLKHDIAVKGNGVHAKGKVVGKGGVSTLTVTLKKGTYEFYCSVPGHEAGGMKGTLTVT